MFRLSKTDLRTQKSGQVKDKSAKGNFLHLNNKHGDPFLLFSILHSIKNFLL